MNACVRVRRRLGRLSRALTVAITRSCDDSMGGVNTKLRNNNNFYIARIIIRSFYLSLPSSRRNSASAENGRWAVSSRERMRSLADFS